MHFEPCNSQPRHSWEYTMGQLFFTTTFANRIISLRTFPFLTVTFLTKIFPMTRPSGHSQTHIPNQDIPHQHILNQDIPPSGHSRPRHSLPGHSRPRHSPSGHWQPGYYQPVAPCCAASSAWGEAEPETVTCCQSNVALFCARLRRLRGRGGGGNLLASST